MREIKFRAWDSKRKYYFIPDHLSFELKNDGLPWCHDGSMYVSSCILEQYTGLKDSKGKEIYEGDIVEIDCPHENERGIIVFEDGCFCQENGHELYLINDYCDIIGNIHENPELIKEIK